MAAEQTCRRGLAAVVVAVGMVAGAVAAQDFDTVEEGLAANLEEMVSLSERACSVGAKPDFLLFNEFPLTGYSFGTRQEKLQFTITVPGPQTDRLGEPLGRSGHLAGVKRRVGRAEACLDRRRDEPGDDRTERRQRGSGRHPGGEAVRQRNEEPALAGDEERHRHRDHAAGDQSGHLDESVPSSPDSGDEASFDPAAELPEEEPAAVASAEESEESQEGSRWSISRFTRGLGDF